MNAFRIFTILVSLLIAGEAAVLAVRMHIVKKSKSPWISLKNDLMLSLDVVVGLVLVLLVSDEPNFPQPVWLPLFTILGLLTHIYRMWEYRARRKGAFCAGQRLYRVNLIKLIGLMTILVWSLLV